MNPLLLLAAGGNAISGVSNLVGRGRARRANKKARKEQLAMLRNSLASFNEQAPRQMVQLGEAQQGLEGGVADERVRDLRTAQDRARMRLETAIKQTKRTKKAENAAGRMEVLGDIAGITSAAAGGLSQLFAKPELPIGEQVGAQMGAGLGGLFGPFAMMGGAQAGQNFARQRALQGLLQKGGY